MLGSNISRKNHPFAHHIVLIGLPAVGKSTIASTIAVLFNRPLYDIDTLIEQQENRTIKTIIETEGEPYFRKIEEKMAVGILQSTDYGIVACGGGTYESAAVRKQCAKTAFVVWLKATPEMLADRMVVRKDSTRPLMNAKKNPTETLQALLKKREAHYTQCHVAMDVLPTHRPQDLAQTIVYFYDAWRKGEKIW